MTTKKMYYVGEVFTMTRGKKYLLVVKTGSYMVVDDFGNVVYLDTSDFANDKPVISLKSIKQSEFNCKPETDIDHGSYFKYFLARSSRI